MRSGPERGDAVVGRAVADDPDDPPLRLRQLHTDCRRQAEAEAAGGREEVAARLAHLHPLPERADGGGGLLDENRVLGGQFVDQVKDRLRVQRAALNGARERAWQGLGHRPRTAVYRFHQGFEGQEEVADQGVTHGRTGGLGRVAGEMHQHCSGGQVVARGELVIAEHRSAYYQDQIVPGEQLRDTGDRSRQHATEARVTGRERAARGRRGDPGRHTQLLRQLHGQRVGAGAVDIRAEHQHRAARP
ncbi:hypothetical protein D9M69_502050 [compost metagenome]